LRVEITILIGKSTDEENGQQINQGKVTRYNAGMGDPEHKAQVSDTGRHAHFGFVVGGWAVGRDDRSGGFPK
jgi:hypothetical protein